MTYTGESPIAVLVEHIWIYSLDLLAEFSKDGIKEGEKSMYRGMGCGNAALHSLCFLYLFEHLHTGMIKPWWCINIISSFFCVSMFF